jgi:anti-sigma B factor antagonist
VGGPDRRIALELSGLEFCDTSGLACFLNAHKALRRAGGSLILLRPPARLRPKLAITGLDKALTIVEDLPDALPGPVTA